MVSWEQVERSDDTDTGIDDRERLFEHLERVIHPRLRGWFVDQIVEAIELAAAGRTEEWIEVDVRRHQVGEVVRLWELEDLVAEAARGEFSPRGGGRSWRTGPPAWWSAEQSKRKIAS